MPKILIFGGGDIAKKGIIPTLGGRCIPHSECDIRNYDRVLSTVGSDKPEIVINCVGVSHVSNIESSDPFVWKEEIEVNLVGSYHIAKACIYHNISTQIYIASVAGKYGKPHHSGYSASKAGVISLVQSLKFEGYNAYAISPGRVNTSMREHDYPGEDIRTRLDPLEIGSLIQDIIENKYESGDNIIIRRIGFETQPIKVDKGEPWREWLKIGEPPVC